ncbi:universal stress protein [Neolewinella persica]|uniref:universal stress protein n=1 Tax=Neolewinella persica TaxID=70998 RepID=UPI000361C490|nr:universal stress protein [Neolewinella persica]
MNQIKSILVPVDFSAIARNAFRYALQLGDHLEASITLLYTVPPASAVPDHAPFAVSFVEELQEEAALGIRQFMNTEIKALSGQLQREPKVNCVVAVGDLRHTIRDKAGEMNNDLIVMGTHGQHDVWDKLLGTNTTFLLKRSPLPLLIVPNGVKFTPCKLLCYATDLQHVDASQVKRLLDAFSVFHPDLHFLHVLPPEKEQTAYDLGRLRELFGNPNAATKTTFATVNNKEVFSGINDYVSRNHCDLVFMHRPEYSWLEDLFRSSNTREAALKANFPLLIFRQEDV